MKSTIEICGKSSVGKARGRTAGAGSLAWLTLGLVICGFPKFVLAQEASGDRHLSDGQSRGSISGRIIGPTGVPIGGATVSLTREDRLLDQELQSDDDGKFFASNLAPGPFRLTVSSPEFATQTLLGNLRPGESYVIPSIVLAIATEVTEVRVVPSQVEVAEEQVKEQEKQRALGFIPNFYVSYVPDAAPLTPKQKFGLAWKTLVDPVTFGLTGGIAGVQQARDDFSGYGQGAEGYAKRYGASYAGTVSGTLIGGAILPSLLKQDPRYFYKGTGSKRSRVLHAVKSSVMCRGDNGRWQLNYSGIIGGLAAGGISNLYYPAKDRNGVGLTFENALIGIGATAAANVLQEFVVRKLTPHVSQNDPGNGGSGAKSFGPIGKMLSAFVHEGD